ncbi:hypothetical protein H4R18_000488 [Coemansia javaensis]|uniref:RING-type domain-containing protein n=1 Tax=Coemansia javaensis TaxID=2761396 RepID=A0A9W8HI53_9FUNG|nr:hypothetical protein H4R18_000488 [Coemansia javaensis]
MSCAICQDSLLLRDDGPALRGSRNASTEWELQPVALDCGHVYHQMCILAWLSRSGGNQGRTCPSCRRIVKGNPRPLFLSGDVAADDDGDGDGDDDEEGGGSSMGAAVLSEETTRAVCGRNLIIRKLCANVTREQRDRDRARAALEAEREKHAALERILGEEREKAKATRHDYDKQRAKVEKLLGMANKHEVDMAKKAREVEDQKIRIRALEAELAEQRQIAATLGSVRATSERLMQSLRKERAKVSSLSTQNRALEVRVAILERAKETRDTAAAASSEADRVGSLQNTFHALPRGSQATSVSQVIDLVSEATSELGFDEDAKAAEDAVAAPWAPPPTPRRPGPTFGMSVKDFAASAGASPNPFAAAQKSTGFVAPTASVTFTMGRAPPAAHPTRLIRPSRATASDGMGGAQRSAADRRKAATMIQSTITQALKR